MSTEQAATKKTVVPRTSKNSTRDPITLAIVQKQLDHITHQMGWVMTRTSRSPVFSESHDFSCFLGTKSGEVAAQADGLPIHSGAGGFALKALIKSYSGDMAEGDIFILSDPYVAGGNHLPDWTIIKPVFIDGILEGFAANRAHQSDIGGGAAGTYNPEATEIFHEGIRLPVMKLVERDKLRKDLWQLLLLNSRTPELLEGDLGAMLGSVNIGAERMLRVMKEDLGNGRGIDYLEGLLDYGEMRLRGEIAKLPDGSWHGEDGSDTDCFVDVDVPVRVKATVAGDDLIFDFTGSAPQVKGFKNSSLANTHSAVYVAVAAFFDASIPRNGGTFRPVCIIAPEGTVVNALPPAPMTMNTIYPATEIVYACWKALAQVLPPSACAGWGKSAYGISSGRKADGRAFVMYHWHATPAGGAVNGRDGYAQGGNLPSLGGRTMPNVETYERLYPCRIHKHELRRDSAGPGEYRGGSSVNYEAQILLPSTHAVRAEGLKRTSGYGVLGGGAGAKGSIVMQEEGGLPQRPPQYIIQRVGPMRVWIEGTAGGGWGDPKKRDPMRVLRDVRDEIVSVQSARDLYGVVIDHTGRNIDVAATKALRGG